LTSSFQDDLAQSLHRYVYCIIRVTRLAAFIAGGEMAVAYFLTSFSGKMLNHAASVLERLFADPEQGRVAVAVLFYVIS
jgi:hypothetical protein